MKKENTIILADASAIITKGLKTIFESSGENYIIQIADTPEHLEIYLNAHNPDTVILNPGFLPEHLPDSLSEHFHTEKKTRFICIIYSYIDEKILRLFDEVIYINDSSEEINNKLTVLLQNSYSAGYTNRDVHLSEREVEVLKHIVTGHSNKEISELLFISTHTVVSHRKNITGKLGIKSVAGLTIYAVLNKIISEEEIRFYFDKL